MSARDPDAWWSPVPGGPGPHDQPAPVVLPPPTRVRAGRRRRTGLLVAVGALVVAVLGTVAVVVGVGGTKVLHDSARTLSVEVPRSWYDNTGAPGSEPGATPVIAASNLWQTRRVEVDRYDVEDGDDLETFHADGVERECSGWPCSSRSGPRNLTVAGHPALEQVVTHPAGPDEGASSSLTVTVWLGDQAIEVYGLATSSGGTAPDAAALRDVAASLQVL